MSGGTDQFWMVVNVSDVCSWENEDKLPLRQRPRFLHPSREAAEIEALRLHQQTVKHSDLTQDEIRFVVVEAVAFTEPLGVLEARISIYGENDPLPIAERPRKKRRSR